MKKVLFINHSPYVYGAESVMLQIMEKVFVHENRKNVYILEPLCEDNSVLKNETGKLDIHNHFILPYKNFGGSFLRSLIVMLYNISAVIRLLFIVKKNKTDIIYSNTSVTCIGVMLSMLTRKPHIWHFHESAYNKDFFQDKKLVSIYRFLIRRKKNMIVFISESQKREWEDFIGQKIKKSTIIYNPIKDFSVEDSSKTPKDLISFGFLGSLDENKNLLSLIKAFAALNKKHPNIRLKIGGEGHVRSQKENIEKLITEYDLKHSVNMLGYVSDISSFYDNIDVFILPSLSETWGLVVLEAMSAMKPVILTQNTGLHEILENNVDCIFINPLSETNLYQAMEKMLDMEFSHQLAKTGYEKIKKINFNHQFIIEFEKLFRSND